jgi:hypothetical protein
MQVLTSTQGDETSGAKIPPWDRVKMIFELLCKILKRVPTREDHMKDLLSASQVARLYQIAGESQNNGNKFIAAAKMGQDFMDLYEEVNTMHMKCTCVMISFVVHVAKFPTVIQL